MPEEDVLFNIYLDPEGEEGAEFRVKNKRGEDERPILVDRKNPLPVQAKLFAVIHGTLEEDGDPASLIICDFRGPDIEAVSPDGEMWMRPTNKEVGVTIGANASVNAGGGPVSGGVGTSWERTTSQTESDRIKVLGYCTQSIERDVGGLNEAAWSLIENESQESGIPSYLRTLTLLKREDYSKYSATIAIKTEVDMSSALRSMFGSTPVDDPISFNPRLTRRRAAQKWAEDHKVDSTNLGSFKMDEAMMIVSAKLHKDVIDS